MAEPTPATSSPIARRLDAAPDAGGRILLGVFVIYKIASGWWGGVHDLDDERTGARLVETGVRHRPLVGDPLPLGLDVVVSAAFLFRAQRDGNGRSSGLVEYAAERWTPSYGARPSM